MFRLRIGALIAAAMMCAGCADLAGLGFTSRVLHRADSPDGRYQAVCQEVPQLDGPSYDVRLESPEGRVIRHLIGLGDGDPCSEMVWSPDGRHLAVLASHVARVQLIDVADAVRRPATERLWPRTISLVWPEGRARHLAFPREGLFEFDACDANRRTRQGCLIDYERRKLEFSR